MELLSPSGVVAAEIIRVDQDRRLKINTFGTELDVSLVEQLISIARSELGTFEDGTSLDDAAVKDVIG